MDKERHLVFVYGSLRKGLSNHRLVENANFIKYMKLNGFEMYDYNGFFPYVYYTGDEDSAIVGEVYEVDDIQFQDLDRLEGISPMNDDSGHYKRRLIGDTGVWIYLGTDEFSDLPKVPKISEILSGDESDKYDFSDWKVYLNYRNKLIAPKNYYKGTSTPSYSNSQTSVNVTGKDFVPDELSEEELLEKYSTRHARYEAYDIEQLRDELKSYSNKYKISNNKKLKQNYYNIINLIGFHLKNSQDGDNEDELHESLYKFLDNKYLRDLETMNPDLFREIVSAVTYGPSKFERLYANLFKEYEKEQNSGKKELLSDSLSLIDKAMAADSNLRKIETEVQKMLGESTDIYMQTIRNENTGTLKALLEEIRENY